MKKFPNPFLLMPQGEQLRLRKDICFWTRRPGSHTQSFTWTSFEGILGVRVDLSVKGYEKKTVLRDGFVMTPTVRPKQLLVFFPSNKALVCCVCQFLWCNLEKEMATHSSILAWRIPGTEEPDRLPSMCRTESDMTETTYQQQRQWYKYSGGG